MTLLKKGDAPSISGMCLPKSGNFQVVAPNKQAFLLSEWEENLRRFTKMAFLQWSHYWIPKIELVYFLGYLV